MIQILYTVYGVRNAHRGIVNKELPKSQNNDKFSNRIRSN